MANQEVDQSKRRFLVAATTAVGGVAVAAVATPFVTSMLPSERAKAAGAPVEVDVTKIEAGSMITVEWRGKPVWVVNRTDAMVAELGKIEDKLTDPRLEAPQQPEYARNATRSIKPNLMVLVGICTHLGCSPSSKLKQGEPDMGGRVFSGSPAPTNLEVPPHFYPSDTRLLIGEDAKEA